MGLNTDCREEAKKRELTGGFSSSNILGRVVLSHEEAEYNYGVKELYSHAPGSQWGGKVDRNENRTRAPAILILIEVERWGRGSGDGGKCSRNHRTNHPIHVPNQLFNVLLSRVGYNGSIQGRLVTSSGSFALFDFFSFRNCVKFRNVKIILDNNNSEKKTNKQTKRKEKQTIIIIILIIKKKNNDKTAGLLKSLKSFGRG